MGGYDSTQMEKSFWAYIYIYIYIYILDTYSKIFNPVQIGLYHADGLMYIYIYS